MTCSRKTHGAHAISMSAVQSRPGFFKDICTAPVGGLLVQPTGWVWGLREGLWSWAGVLAHSQVLFLRQACEGRGWHSQTAVGMYGLGCLCCC